MPEIAEVASQRNEIESLFRGQVLREIELDDRFGARGVEKLRGQKLCAVLRYGKLLGLEFERDMLAVHLRMTGGFFLQPVPHTRASFLFDQPLYFADSRRFATIEWADPWSALVAKMGPDLWSVVPGWLPPDRFRFSRRAIKTTLLDQRVLAGIGNYLADESLWAARVSPFSETATLSDRDWENIIGEVQALSKKVLRAGGVSVRDYKNLSGRDGSGQNLLQVYGRSGKPCPRCGALLRKDRISGRGTTWCDVCQG